MVARTATAGTPFRAHKSYRLRDIALYHGEGHGWIEVVTGVMFSGKNAYEG